MSVLFLFVLGFFLISVFCLGSTLLILHFEAKEVEEMRKERFC